jgi:hypothetical protein
MDGSSESSAGVMAYPKSAELSLPAGPAADRASSLLAVSAEVKWWPRLERNCHRQYTANTRPTSKAT